MVVVACRLRGNRPSVAVLVVMKSHQPPQRTGQEVREVINNLGLEPYVPLKPVPSSRQTMATSSAGLHWCLPLSGVLTSVLQPDDSQTAFCEAPVGNPRLLASAGCGKTLCLLRRCRHLSRLSGKHWIRCLVVTLTRAAKQELLARLNEEAEVADLRDSTEVTTLNSWGWRRVRNIAFSPKPVTSQSDYHFAIVNQLQGKWKDHRDVRRAGVGDGLALGYVKVPIPWG